MPDAKNIEEKIFNQQESMPSIEDVNDLDFEKIPVNPEKKEKLEESVAKSIEDEPSTSVVSDKSGGLAAESSVEAINRKREAAIDAILADGLSDVFLKMKPDKQKEFKEEGEKTVKKISQLLSEAKVKVAKVLDLVKKWLKIIPGVNKFFVEQEAKLKTDKIIRMRKDI